MHRQLALLEPAVAQYDDELAVPDGGFCLAADLVEGVGQGQPVVDVEIDVLVVLLVHVGSEQLAQLFLRQHR